MQPQDLLQVEHETLSSISYIVLVGMVIAGSLIALIIRSFFSDRKLRYTANTINEFIRNQSEFNQCQTKFNAQVSSAIMLLTQDRVSECSLGQVKVLSRCVIDSYLSDIIYGTMSVIEKNQLNKRSIVEKRAEGMVDNAVKSAASYMDIFLFNGKTLTTMLNQESWKVKTVQTVMDTIYTNEDRLLYLYREISTLKDTLSNEYYENLKKVYNENILIQTNN